MRVLPVFLLVLFLAASSALPQRTRTPVPVGVREGEKAMEQPIEPPLYAPHFKHTTPAELEQEAVALAKLANMVQAEVEVAATKNKMAKDLPRNLKDLEKLAKRLHSQLAP